VNVGVTGSQNLRTMILSGDFYLASVVATTLTKIALKVQTFPISAVMKNSFTVEVLLILSGLLQLGKSNITPVAVDADSYDRIGVCVRVLAQPLEFTKKIFLESCHKVFSSMLEEQHKTVVPTVEKKKEIFTVQADDLIKIRQLKVKKFAGEDDFDESEIKPPLKDDGNRLNRVYQLTGFSDPIYAEAYVTVHQYDIVLDILVSNQTGDTLQQVSLELATLGDLKLVERPQTYNLGAYGKKEIRANIKVSSTETGIIFGNLVYDIAGSTAQDKNCVILNDIHIDIMDFIHPADCTDLQFRNMWAEFEWENKVAINTSITDSKDYLNHIIKSTNMKCLTPESALSGCGFLSANLYARSIFSEDALANISLETTAEGKIAGYIRIRSKTQGIALSLGDKITQKQKGG